MAAADCSDFVVSGSIEGEVMEVWSRLPREDAVWSLACEVLPVTGFMAVDYDN